MATSITSSSSNSTSSPNITNLMPIKLDNSNFLNWQHQVLTILKTLGLLDFLKQDVISPIDDAAKSFWDRSDAYVTAIIMASLSPSLVHIARGSTSSSDLFLQTRIFFVHSFIP